MNTDKRKAVSDAVFQLGYHLPPEAENERVRKCYEAVMAAQTDRELAKAVKDYCAEAGAAMAATLVGKDEPDPSSEASGVYSHDEGVGA